MVCCIQLVTETWSIPGRSLARELRSAMEDLDPGLVGYSVPWREHCVSRDLWGVLLERHCVVFLFLFVFVVFSFLFSIWSCNIYIYLFIWLMWCPPVDCSREPKMMATAASLP